MGLHPELTNESARRTASRPALQLFALSFTALFLELMLIRWVPAVVRLVAYYANLMLISSFLGLGIGALLARRRWRLFHLFPLLLAAQIALLIASSGVALPGSSEEHRFFVAETKVLNYLMLVAIFVMNTLLFAPLGQRIGQLFHELPALRAYSWDLGGSLAGTLGFGLFSLLYFSPILGMLGVMAIYLIVSPRGSRTLAYVLFPLSLAGIFFATRAGGIWSPYHFITIEAMFGEPGETWDGLSEPPNGLRTMLNPPIYFVRVGRDFYQQHGTINPNRYTMGRRLAWTIKLYHHYSLPYQLAPRFDRVLVLGAGGGSDCEAALRAGAKHVDAVDIDPILPEISRKYNSSGVYLDPRVTTHVDDARAFLRRLDHTYDMVVFGRLDSQSLFSSMANLRIDGFIYTLESLRTAFSRVGEQGTLVISFYSPTPWLTPKLIQTVREATGVEPVCYFGEDTVVICASRGTVRNLPDEYGPLVRLYPQPSYDIDLPTDDWPFLYLSKRTIPEDYLIVISTLIVFSIIAVGSVRGASISTSDAHFFFMGLAFLLLQTKSITDCSLYFGTTWLVTTIVITGVLLMVLLANLIAIRLRGPSRWHYLPLLASLLLLYFVPRDMILAQPFGVRLAWSILVVPLPIFFAGLIFSTTFREAPDPSIAFGSNLIGATIGGFFEYLGMAVGSNALSWVVMGAYLASFMCVRMVKRRQQVMIGAQTVAT